MLINDELDFHLLPVIIGINDEEVFHRLHITNSKNKKLFETISGFSLKVIKNLIWVNSSNIKCVFRIWKFLGRRGLY